MQIIKFTSMRNTEKDNRTKLQKRFEEQTPTIKNIRGREYLQTYCAWLELQVEKLSEGETPKVITNEDNRKLCVKHANCSFFGKNIKNCSIKYHACYKV